MLRYKTQTRPGLVALYDIRPGYGAGLFLQPQSPYRASYTTASPVSSSVHVYQFVMQSATEANTAWPSYHRQVQ